MVPTLRQMVSWTSASEKRCASGSTLAPSNVRGNLLTPYAASAALRYSSAYSKRKARSQILKTEPWRSGTVSRIGMPSTTVDCDLDLLEMSTWSSATVNCAWTRLTFGSWMRMSDSALLQTISTQKKSCCELGSRDSRQWGTGGSSPRLNWTGGSHVPELSEAIYRNGHTCYNPSQFIKIINSRGTYGDHSTSVEPAAGLASGGRATHRPITTVSYRGKRAPSLPFFLMTTTSPNNSPKSSVTSMLAL